MRNRILLPSFTALAAVAVFAGGCAPDYARAEVVYAEPAPYYYVEPVDHVVVVSQAVLVQRGYTVVRVEHDGPNRVIWARHGDDDMVRVFVRPEGERVSVRGLEERQRHDNGKHKGWERHGNADDVLGDIDSRMKEHHGREH